MRFEEVTTRRDCEMVQIPNGTLVTIPAGTPVVVTQALGDSFTVQIPTLGGLYRVAGVDADVVGRARPMAGPDGRPPGEPPRVDEALVLEQLRGVYDPEIPVNIVELGLIYDLKIEPHPKGGTLVRVKMTLTAPGCGMGSIIADDARRRIESVPGVTEADVEVVFDPPWNQGMMSEAAKLDLGFI